MSSSTCNRQSSHRGQKCLSCARPLLYDGRRSREGHRFLANIDIGVHRAFKLTDNTMRDGRATIFWKSSQTNDLMYSIAAGATSGGFWYEGFNEEQGSAKKSKVPGLNTTKSSREPFGKFNGDVAHTMFDAFMTYPGGMFVPYKWPAFPEDMFAWSVYRGWLSRSGWNQKATNAVFLDIHTCGVQKCHVKGHEIRTSLLLALSTTAFHTPKTLLLHFTTTSPISTGERASPVCASRTCTWQTSHPSVVALRRKLGCRYTMKRWINGSYLERSSETSCIGNVDTKWDLAFPVAKHKQLGFRVRNADLLGITPSEDGYFVMWAGTPGVGVMGFRHGCSFRPGLGFNVVFCPNLCWRHMALMYKELPAPYAPTSVRFEQLDGHHWTETPEITSRFPNGILVDRVVFTLFSAQTYRVFLLDRFGRNVPPNLYSMENMHLYRVDEAKGEPDALGKSISFCKAWSTCQDLHHSLNVPAIILNIFPFWNMNKNCSMKCHIKSWQYRSWHISDMKS